MSDSPPPAKGHHRITVAEYARREGISRATAWRWIRKGLVAVTRKGPRTGVRVVVAPDQ